MKTYQITLSEKELWQILDVIESYAETLNLTDDNDRTFYKQLAPTYKYICGQAKHQGLYDLIDFSRLKEF